MMGGIFSAPKKPDPLPVPEAPVGTGTPGEGDTRAKKLMKSGRGGTIIAGPLVPEAKKKPLLGGAR